MQWKTEEMEETAKKNTFLSITQIKLLLLGY